MTEDISYTKGHEGPCCLGCELKVETGKLDPEELHPRCCCKDRRSREEAEAALEYKLTDVSDG